ncbi:hypothetical protein HK102_005352 [Quaeritorhiza haematococci]|nr:hypothetical protein HK102_005352 [Quaeritorhiza haematococci]
MSIDTQRLRLHVYESADPNLKGYQKKKYICKLLYIYILGWDVDFGHLEAVNLISSNKYSEKQIGYLAVTLLLTENSDLIRLVVNSIRKDLDDSNEIYNCLALQAIANTGGREMAESLAGDVQRLLLSSSSRSFVKKKAALCLLRLFRKHPDVVPAQDWAGRLVNILDEPDLGVCLASTSLITALAQQYPDEYALCAQKAIARLHKIVMEKAYSSEYVYYKVPVPWLQVKLLRLLQYFPPPQEAGLRNRLMTVLQTIINNAQDIPKNVQHNNAQNAVLFEAINLSIHIDSESAIVTQAATLLGRFISSKETNIRYLGLETMAHLAGFAESLDAIKKHQETVIQSLKDKDISVRRRALDLLYSMCDRSNAKMIVSELLRYLQISDYAIREEMVLKIAILTEKFASDFQWYVDVVLQLIAIAGDHVSDEVWYRVVQIVTNNEDLHEYATMSIYNTVKSPSCHENALKVGGYILGEFGHLIANQPGCSPIEQFRALHSKFSMSQAATRALLLTTYLKFANLFPEIKTDVMRTFEQYRYVLDVELQQRACEYLAITSLPTDELLQVVCEEMPLFPERESALLSQLHKKIADTEDKRTWNIGGKDANRARNNMRRQIAAGKATAPAPGPAPTSSSSPQKPVDVLADLMSNGPAYPTPQLQSQSQPHPPPQQQSAPQPAPQQQQARPSADADLLSLLEPAHSSTTDQLFERLVVLSNGVLYEDDILQIGVKSEYQAHLGRVALFFGNKSAQPVQDLAIEVISSPELRITLVQGISSTVPPGAQYHQMYNVECVGVPRKPPILQLSYFWAGALSDTPATLNLRMPILITKFVNPVVLNGPDFFARWRQIGGAPREVQFVFKTGSGKPIVVDVVRKVLSGLRFGVLDGIDPNPNNFVGAGIFSSAEAGKVGCLLRLEINMEQQVCYVLVLLSAVYFLGSKLRMDTSQWKMFWRLNSRDNKHVLISPYAHFIPFTSKQMFRLTIRTTNELVSDCVAEVVKETLTNVPIV